MDLQRRFGRLVSTGPFIPVVDGLRFPALAIVVRGHLCACFNEVDYYPPARSAAEAALA